ncbi:MAG TPA: VOC family protein [Pseudoxanthomonas sp.]|nr:VOC family protein [Pseudoxanthomonas sp.]
MARTIPVPAGSNTVNPFLITDRASDLIAFLVDVFGAEEVPEARTLDTDGLILHAELRIGDALLTLADRKPDWPFTPALTRVYVADAAATLVHAVQRGAQVVTRPTPFFGDTLARFQDPSGNLWWVQQHDPLAVASWDDGAGPLEDAHDEGWACSNPDLDEIHATLMVAMAGLRDPRTAPG